MFSLLHPQKYDTPLFSFIDRQPSIGLNESSSPSSRAEYYRHLADQHERIAQLASARAREQQERNAELERQRMAALLHHGHSNEPSSHPPPRYPEDGLHPHNTLPLSTHLQEPSSGYGSSAGINHHHLPSDEEQFLNYLLARREARLNEEERIRREAAATRERQEYEARDRALLQLLRRLGTDRQQEEDNNPITHTPSGHDGVLEQVTRQPTHSFSQVPTLLRAHEPRHQVSIENPIDRLWSSWASQLSDDDKATVLESFGVSVPRTVTNTQRREVSAGLSVSFDRTKTFQS
ncbi:hypothetical protein FRC03_002167 [Tulasnella sp. 419]|nr:hypothetical protein FRC03_002167 [Tulasnella sp. 419]